MIRPGSMEFAEYEQAQPALTKVRFASQGEDPAVLADVYHENVNIAIWQREPSSLLKAAVDTFISANELFMSTTTVSPRSALPEVSDFLGVDSHDPLAADMAELVDMFCCLLGVKRAGLRLGVLSAAMCPKFHVDMVPCRMITTFRGTGTEWLQHEAVDRSMLGQAGSDTGAGYLDASHEIERLSCGDVALLKGEAWEGNAGAGLVHRSPTVAEGDPRLLLTLDLAD